MSKHIDEQISEFIDDEMSVDECEFFVRRLQRDSDARARYLRYQLIGVAVRGEHCAINAASAPMIAAANASAESPERDRPTAGRRAVAGIGIAASVALAAVLGFQWAGVDDAGQALSETPDVAETAASFEVQIADNSARDLGPQADVMGVQYLMQHTSFTSGLSRTIMHSSVISGPQFEAAEEIGDDALR